jgi:hypothetical protein
VLARKYGMDNWLLDAYLDVCENAHLPTQEDSLVLGFETYRMIAEAREERLRPLGL